MSLNQGSPIIASIHFGPTSSVAATKTQIGSTVNNYAKSMCIKAIRVAKGNVTNAKSNPGLVEVEIKGVDGPFQYAYGGGIGGASNSHNIPAESIACSIPIPAGAQIAVYLTDLNAAVDCEISLSLTEGEGQKIRSYGQVSAAGAASADADENMGATTIIADGRIIEFRFAASGVVDAKAASGKLHIAIGGYPWDLDFAVGNGSGGATLGGPSHAEVLPNLSIPVVKNQTVTPHITMAEASESPYYSFQVA